MNQIVNTINFVWCGMAFNLFYLNSTKFPKHLIDKNNDVATKVDLVAYLCRFLGLMNLAGSVMGFMSIFNLFDSQSRLYIMFSILHLGQFYGNLKKNLVYPGK